MSWWYNIREGVWVAHKTAVSGVVEFEPTNLDKPFRALAISRSNIQLSERYETLKGAMTAIEKEFRGD